ncbi:MAG: PEP-CTERM sorting domain-containing protein [Acetobacteraceae bacterium]
MHSAEEAVIHPCRRNRHQTERWEIVRMLATITRYLTGLTLTAALMAGSAQAATLTRTFEFSGTFPSGINPFEGSVTATFSTTSNASNQTSDITLNSLPFSLGSTIGFSYDALHDEIRFGGIANNVSTLDAATNDFMIWIAGASGSTPTVVNLMYYLPSELGPPHFMTTATVTIATAAPEPATIAVFGLGLGALGLVRNRRRA